MSAVGGLPREVGGQKGGVQDEAHGVVENVVFGEAAVATFVADDLGMLSIALLHDLRLPLTYPQPGHLHALDVSVCSPSDVSC